jgi:predicted RNase H-like HicB family nuclease
MKRYLAILEHADDDSWSVYVPDLPGCTSFGETREKAARNVRDAVEIYLEELRSDGQEPPEPTSEAEFIQVG